MKHVRDPLPDVQRRSPRSRPRSRAWSSARPPRRRRTATRTWTSWCTTGGGARHRGRSHRAGHRRGHHGCCARCRATRRTSRRSACGRPRALALTLLVLAALAATGRVPRHAHREGARRRPGREEAARTQRGAPGRRRGERLRPGGGQRGVVRGRPLRDRRRAAARTGTRRATRAGSPATTSRAWGCTSTPGKLVAARALALVTASPDFKAAVYGSETVPPNLKGWTEAHPREAGEAGLQLPVQHSRPQVPQLSALDQRAASRQGEGSDPGAVAPQVALRARWARACRPASGRPRTITTSLPLST